MVSVKAVSDYINSFAPFDTQCSWDNSGILIGDESAEVKKIGVCLDLTSETVEDAKKQGVDLIVSHHPAIFAPQKTFLKGNNAYEVALAGINLISTHTPFDCADEGINGVLCDLLGIKNAKGLKSEESFVPMARIGEVEEQSSLDFARFVAGKLGTVCRVSDAENTIKKVAVCGGAGIDFFFDAVREGVDAFVTGEGKYHRMLDAKDWGITFIEAGHFETENPAMSVIKNKLEEQFKEIEVVLLNQSTPIKYVF